MSSQKDEIKPSKSLNALQLTETGHEINTVAFRTVMEKVGDRPFVLYSINGTTRTGKSFVLNYLIKYFESLKLNKENDLDSINFQLDSTFITGVRQDRPTEGIHLWSEPYIVKTKNGKEVAIVLMDTQSLFDEITTPFQDAFIMSLSTLCSSVMIFNATRLLNEDILQELQFYSKYASTSMNQDLAPEVVVRVSDNSYPYVNLEMETNKMSPQKLLFLLQDFELPDYGYGLHGDKRKPKDSIKNYFTDTFRSEGREDCSDEKCKFVRENLLSNYSQVSIFTLPDPGKPFKRQQGEPNEDFLEGLKDFIQFLVSDENLVTKKFGDIQVTGTEFILYVDKWAQVCKRDAEGGFPSFQTITESTAWTTYSIAHRIALNYIEQRVNDLLVGPSKQSGIISLKQLEEWRFEVTDAAMKIFSRQKKIRNANIEVEFKSKLLNDILVHCKSLEVPIQKRLDIETCFRSQLWDLEVLTFNLDQGVKDLNEALQHNKTKPSREITQHLKDANEFLNYCNVLQMNVKLDDDVAPIVRKVKLLNNNNERLLEEQRKSCSIA